MGDPENTHDPLEEGDLLAYLEGFASPDVARYIDQTAELVAEAADLHSLDSLLKEIYHQATCPDIDDLLLYQAGLLSGAEQQQMADRIAACPACQQEVRQLALSPDLPATEAPTVRDSMRQRLTALGKRVLDALPLAMPAQPAFAVRGGEPRQLVYSAGPYQIILALVPPMVDERIWQIEGQLSRQDDTLPPEVSAAVRIFRDDVEIGSDPIDEFGFFALEQLETGSYIFQIELADDIILIEPIDLA